MPTQRPESAIVWPTQYEFASETGRGGGPERREDSRLDLAGVALSIWRRKGLVLGTIVLVVGAMAAYSYWVVPVYASRSIVSIDTSLKTSGGPIMLGETRALTGEVGVLRNSIELAESVVKRLDAEVAGVDSGATEAGVEIEPVIPEAAPADSDEDGAAEVRQAAMALLGRMQFQVLSAEEMIQITAEDEDPERAARIANLYAEEYESLSRENSRARIRAAREAIEAQVAIRGGELAGLEDQWVGVAQRNRSAAQGLQGDAYAQEYAELRSAREATRLAIDQEQSSLVVLRQQLEAAESRLPSALQQESEASGLRVQIDALDANIAALSVEAEKYYAVRPELRGNESQDRKLAEITNRAQRLQARKAELSNQLSASLLGSSARIEEGGQLGRVLQLRQAVAENESKLQQLLAQNQAISRRAGAYQAPIQGFPRQDLTRERLESRRAQTQQWYSTAVDRLLEVEVAEQSELGYVSLVRGAMPPTRPVRPNTPQNLLLGLLLGLGGGVGLALVRESVDLRYTQPEDLEDESHRLIGVVPDFSRTLPSASASEENGASDARVIALSDPWSAVADHFRLIRTRIEHDATETPTKVLLVTSPEAGDGKSVTAANLAVVLARNHNRTLLIDADLRKPTLHSLLGVPQWPGLAEYLQERHALHPGDLSTSVENLAFIPAGLTDVPPSEILGSPAMSTLLEMTRGHYDFVVIDSPPVLAVPDAVTLAPLCDGAVTVVSAGRTDRRKLNWTRRAIEGVGTPMDGVILTRYTISRFGRYQNEYGDGYSGRYGMPHLEPA